LLTQSHLWQLLDEAHRSPTTTDLAQLWYYLEQTLEPLPLELKLSTAARAFSQIAIILKAKSEQVLRDWEDRNHPGGPVIDTDLFAGLVRTHQQLNLQDLKASLELPPLIYRSRQGREKINPDDSVVAVVEPEKILKMVGEIEKARSVLDLAEQEYPSQWIEKIDRCLEHRPLPIQLTELLGSLELQTVELWLGLLLGDFQLEQRGEFYDIKSIWIICKRIRSLEQ
jgi:chromatin segregation and condensation protein Rec8/ScpA/Scc1 (kleisin family)